MAAQPKSSQSACVHGSNRRLERRTSVLSSRARPRCQHRKSDADSRFRRASYREANTDKADAALIARFCKAMQPNAWEAPTPAERRLRQLVRRRRALIEMRTQEINRLEAPGTESIEKSIRDIIAMLENQIAELEADIKKTIDDDDDLKGKRGLDREHRRNRTDHIGDDICRDTAHRKLRKRQGPNGVRRCLPPRATIG